MKAITNRELFTQKTFDSGALGVMASVVHPFTRPGRYRALVRKNDAEVGSFLFSVDESSEVMQLDVDLATAAYMLKGGKGSDCNCHDEDLKRVVSPQGYVLFHASTGGGYAVKAGLQEGKYAEFDSAQLGEGDLFALSLLEPTRYTLVDRFAGAQGEIHVTFSPEDARRLKSLTTVHVEAGRSHFEPARIHLVSTQGLVFHACGLSRVVIEKVGSAAASESEDPGKRRWVKP